MGHPAGLCFKQQLQLLAKLLTQDRLPTVDENSLEDEEEANVLLSLNPPSDVWLEGENGLDLDNVPAKPGNPMATRESNDLSLCRGSLRPSKLLHERPTSSALGAISPLPHKCSRTMPQAPRILLRLHFRTWIGLLHGRFLGR